MSRFIPLITVLFFTSCGTLAPPELQTFQKVIDIDGVKKNVLFVRANKWVVDNFVKANSVIEFSDKEAGTVAGKYIIDNYFTLFKSHITIDVKDGKVRIQFSSPMSKVTATIFGPVLNTDYRPITVDEMSIVRKEWLILVDSFEKSMKSSNSDF